VNPVPVLWVIPYAELDLGTLREQLLAYNFHVICCLPRAYTHVEAPLRVLQTDFFPDLHHLHEEYHADQRPTLIVASSEDLEIAAIKLISETGDVVRGTGSIELLAFRLTRLLRHASELDRIDALQHTDPLTGLSNRKRFRALMSEIIGASVGNERWALVLLDLDHFKTINDTRGHAAGDEILRQFAALLQESGAPGDYFGRLGGDEFVCLISRYDRDTARSDIVNLLKRVEQHPFLRSPLIPGETVSWAAGVSFRRKMRAFNTNVPLEPEEQTRIRMTASAGMSFVRPQSSAEDLLHHADLALYEAKSKGRNQLVVYEQMEDCAAAEDKDLDTEHFKNVLRVFAERMTMLVARIGENLVEEARRDANHDALTKVYNRRYFDRRLEREIERACRADCPLTIALMDLDHFGDLNKTFGYPTGDRALSRFAQIATSGIRSLDWLARYGGEEFCLVMPDTALASGMHVAERLRTAVESAVIQSLDQRRVPLTVSIGVVQWSADLTRSVDLVQKASNAVLQAKRDGRNRVVADR
jgi:two-component system cell cycle response regulator